ncbi:hypothetical protein QTP81_16470 [Alteromonas sp. ASW11-36]|uniref:DUF4856 domain-containing protein n=1 Tax=Alteromonas arenosi TaxID=3055817 RepID=A0ABT7T324_9ALTE|nr:hypothetical protein [Alteromonas sp. ASW11-36]MDM7862202.1 hypothetical protein [Alteromonas sp. ASW11-36]
MKLKLLALCNLLLILTGCQVTEPQVFTPKTLFLPVDTPVIDVQQQTYLTQMNAYHQAPYDEVKMAYVQLINSVDQFPEEQYCSSEMLAVVAKALALHPTSIAAHSMNRGCGTIIGSEALVAESEMAIAHITELLLANGTGGTKATSIGTRELYEAQYMLQWADIEVFDVELVATKNKNYFLNHAVDTVNGGYTFFYSDIAKAFGTNMYSITGYHYNDRLRASLLRMELLRSGEYSGVLYQLRDWLYRGDYQAVVDKVDNTDDISPVLVYLAAHAHFNLGNMDEFDILADRLIEYSQAGVTDAEIFLGLILLENNPDELAMMNDMFARHNEYHGVENSVDFWLRVMVAHQALSDMHRQWLSQLPSDSRNALADGIRRWLDQYPSDNNAMKQRLEDILLVAEQGVVI